MPLPPELQRIADEIGDADRAADAISAAVTDEQFHWRPDGTGWSIAQCLDHLAVINAIYMKALQAGVDQANARGWRRRGPSVPGLIGGWFARSMEPPVTRRLSAPAGTQPSPRRDRGEILGAYHAAHDQFRLILAECADLDTNRATFRNPFIKVVRVKVSSGLRVIPAHDRRHLWQAKQIRRRQGFPNA